MLPAGTATNSILKHLTPLLTKGDVVIEGGNSHFEGHRKKSQRIS